MRKLYGIYQVSVFVVGDESRLPDGEVDEAGFLRLMECVRAGLEDGGRRALGAAVPGRWDVEAVCR